MCDFFRIDPSLRHEINNVALSKSCYDYCKKKRTYVVFFVVEPCLKNPVNLMPEQQAKRASGRPGNLDMQI
jgi:hypothetical protein